MQKRWSFRATAPLAALVLMACRGTDSANDQRLAQAGQRAPAPQAPSYATVQLSGCLEAAAGTARYVLQSVRFEPRQGDPHAGTTTSANHGITDGAWVRLQGTDQNLTQYLGQRVTVTGTIADDGANRKGIAGTAGLQTPSGDRSQAAQSGQHHSEKQKLEMGRIARESLADGTAAEIRVQQVKSTGEKCEQAQRPERR